ncbi:MAG: hypothetical protein ACK5F0_11885 [Flavobacteriales bacterium]|jgi:hypothetical protein
MFKKIIYLFVFIIQGIHAQQLIHGKASLIEFNNSTSKFIVPSGKTWQINKVFSIPHCENCHNVKILIKSINGTELTNLNTKKFGPTIYNPSTYYWDNPLPLTLPENSVIEFIILEKKDGEPSVLSSRFAFINYLEFDE